ncbi:hypothetical protein QUF80_01795 [Desulfococcaceae bacterium HSG8]|nr:hypothetical protein [Desulfococcaceae bacterium HSG8]
MRIHLAILIILLNLSARPAIGSDDVFWGKVRSVERESGEVVLQVADPDDENADRPKEVTVKIPPDRLPAYVVTGRMVQVWGTYMKDKAVIQARHIRNRGWKHDPTGVRKRLDKRRKKTKFRRPPRHHRGH